MADPDPKINGSSGLPVVRSVERRTIKLAESADFRRLGLGSSKVWRSGFPAAKALWSALRALIPIWKLE